LSERSLASTATKSYPPQAGYDEVVRQRRTSIIVVIRYAHKQLWQKEVSVYDGGKLQMSAPRRGKGVCRFGLGFSFWFLVGNSVQNQFFMDERGAFL